MLVEFIKPDFSFSDDRGSILQLVHEGWSQVNYIASLPGASRGGHYHTQNREAFYVIAGSFTLMVENGNTGEKEIHEIKAGDFFIISASAKHTFSFHEPTQLISLYDKGVELPDGSKDIFT